MDNKARKDMYRRQTIHPHAVKQGLNDSYMSYTEPEESDFGMMHELNSSVSVNQLPSHGGGYISSGMPIFSDKREAYHREPK